MEGGREGVGVGRKEGRQAGRQAGRIDCRTDVITQTFKCCLDIWQCRDEHNNFEQKYDAELVKEAKR